MTSHRTSSRRWRASFAAAGLLAGALALPGVAAAQTEAICPVPDPAACLLECRIENARCWSACRSDKNHCIERARLDLRVCKLDCREDDTVENVGACRRDCVKAALRTAVAECDVGQPVCVRECHPYSCARECGLGDDGDGNVPGLDAGAEGDCVPPVDRECLGGCASELRACIKPVREAARECAAGCAELPEGERRACYAGCVTVASEGATACRGEFRECASGCVSDEAPPVDPECLGECRSDLGSCVEDAFAGGRVCAEQCVELEGDARRECFTRCVSGAKEAAGLCQSDFRICVEACAGNVIG